MQKIKIYSIYIIAIFYIIHICLFYISKGKNKIISDIEILNKKNSKNWSCLFSLIYYLIYDGYFKIIFYHRIKDCKLRHLLFIRNRNNFIIPNDVILGNSLSYSHPYSTILNAKKIGDNFSFKHMTTIGNKNDDEQLRPILLNNVTLGAGVIIFGDIIIGNNVTIGAGSVVSKSVPDNAVVVGNPAKIIRFNR